jgi:hypothetical protein
MTQTLMDRTPANRDQPDIQKGNSWGQTRSSQDILQYGTFHIEAVVFLIAV